MAPTLAGSREADLRRPAGAAPLGRNATDDEILGILDTSTRKLREAAQALDAAPDADAVANPQLGFDFEATDRDAAAPAGEDAEDNSADASAARLAVDANGEPENLRAVFDAHPEARRAWRDAQAYRGTFATPEEARAATALLADLNRMDALFFSQRPGDHAELARAVAQLDPVAFASLAQAINDLAGASQAPAGAAANRGNAAQALRPEASRAEANAGANAQTVEPREAQSSPRTRATSPSGENSAVNIAPGLTPAQAEFFHATNAAAVQSVLDAIESQVERLLPEGISKNARNRVVGEIYRELDNTLRSNRQLAQQMREAFRSGALDEDHQRALVSLVTGRARQALPGVAKRVLNEWTSTIVAANQGRRARQSAAERRVDIAGSGGAANDGRRSIGPRDIDYGRMSDADILNL